MSEPLALDGKSAALRRAFDDSFAAPAERRSEELEDLLRVRVAGDPYAIRVRDLAGIVARHKVVPVPGGTPDLLGTAGIRGGIVPVFALSLLLGYGQAADAAAWIALCGSADPIALAFPELEGYARIPRSSIHLDDHRHPGRTYVKEVARMDHESRAVISIPLIVAAIRNRTGPAKEH